MPKIAERAIPKMVLVKNSCRTRKVEPIIPPKDRCTAQPAELRLPRQIVEKFTSLCLSNAARMTRTAEIAVKRKLPTRKDAFVFRGKTALFQMRRAVSDVFDRTLTRHVRSAGLADAPVIARSRTLLWTESDPNERMLIAGKIQNLRLAARELNGVEVPAGKTFGFWKQIGRTTSLRGFAAGRELREGCIIPTVGGGLCQLSNALYDAALQAGFEIVERHAHTQVIPGSLAEKGRDATVFWNYVDLRFRSSSAFRIEARLEGGELNVQFRGVGKPQKKIHSIGRTVLHSDNPNSCASCEQGDCHKVMRTNAGPGLDRTAFLVDEYSPEFDDYLTKHSRRSDQLMIPLDGRRFGKPNYAWATGEFGSVHQSLVATAKRSYSSRKLAAQGAARQRDLLRTYEELANSYARRLGYDVLNVVVHQNLLPFLWKSGDLGGRTFDVLMTALPMAEIELRLDRAALLHPESTTLGDFRADPQLVELEAEALRHARKIITPHTDIAAHFTERAELVEWKRPKAARRLASNAKPRVVFPASTVGRKGCYELREALSGLDVKLTLLGPIIENPNFWDGYDTQSPGADWLESADLVVLPAHIEHRPRRLLLAAAAEIPVIATYACGTAGVAGIQHIDAGDAAGLRAAIAAALSRF